MLDKGPYLIKIEIEGCEIVFFKDTDLTKEIVFARARLRPKPLDFNVIKFGGSAPHKRWVNYFILLFFYF